MTACVVISIYRLGFVHTYGLSFILIMDSDREEMARDVVKTVILSTTKKCLLDACKASGRYPPASDQDIIA